MLGKNPTGRGQTYRFSLNFGTGIKAGLAPFFGGWLNASIKEQDTPECRISFKEKALYDVYFIGLGIGAQAKFDPSYPLFGFGDGEIFNTKGKIKRELKEFEGIGNLTFYIDATYKFLSGSFVSVLLPDGSFVEPYPDAGVEIGTGLAAFTAFAYWTLKSYTF